MTGSRLPARRQRHRCAAAPAKAGGQGNGYGAAGGQACGGRSGGRRRHLSAWAWLALAVASGPAPAAAQLSPAGGAAPAAAAVAAPLPIDAYRTVAERLRARALASRAAYDRLGVLCDRIGHRLSGSSALDTAIVWAAAQMRRDGLHNVHTEPVMVPVWVRGDERAWTVEPVRHDLSLLGLGGSVGTPPAGITAPALVVGSFAELDSLGPRAVAGRIVVYDVPFTSYGETVRYRSSGASRAGALGAVAALVRSVGPISYDTPHTGSLRYADDGPRVPAAAITIEDATLLRRTQQRGDPLVVHLEMGARTLPDAPSANVVGEIVGRELPQEVVVIGGHIDSWDVGQGAQDDGVGCVIAMEAARLMQELSLRPRRTVRIVLFTNEENGLRGGLGYRDAHRAELADHVAMLESDLGNGRVQGFRLHLPPLGATDAPGAGGWEAAERPTDDPVLSAARERGLGLLNAIGGLLEQLGATQMRLGGSGADVGPSVEAGAVGLGVDHDGTHYFDVHHSRADTFEKIAADDLARNVASVAIMAYVLAEMPPRLLPRADAPATH